MVVLVSCDGQAFDVDASTLTMSRMIENLMSDTDDDMIPVPNVTGKVLEKVLEWCKRHAAGGDDLDAYNKDYASMDLPDLADVIMAANFLDIRGLLDVLCKRVADMIRGKSTEELRTIFNIKNDFTPEEEREIRNENLWAFE